MNFLAHLHLSDPEPHARIGSMLADFVKGPDFDKLPKTIQAGVRTHRLVDAFTDSHPLVNRSIARISHEWGWFSGIIIDVYYDHILAKNWDRYSNVPLRTFADEAYEVLLDGIEFWNDEDKPFLQKFISTDRLVSYATVSGIAETMYRVSKVVAMRIPKRALPLEQSMPLLTELHDELAADFSGFYPELQQRIQSQPNPM